MFSFFRKYRQERAIRRRLLALTPAERAAIVEVSPYDAAGFQGEGYHVFRKGIANLNEGYVCSLGEIPSADAEDWIIRQYWEENSL